jgi:hypothetical protein
VMRQWGYLRWFRADLARCRIVGSRSSLRVSARSLKRPSSKNVLKQIPHRHPVFRLRERFGVDRHLPGEEITQLPGLDLA